MKHFKLLAALTFILFFQISYAQNDAIDKIEYSEVDGGKGGGKIHLIVTKDSLVYTATGRGEKAIAKRIKTPNGMWDKIKAILPFDDFKKVKNGRSQLAHDDTDVTLSVLSNNVRYVVLTAMMIPPIIRC